MVGEVASLTDVRTFRGARATTLCSVILPVRQIGTLSSRGRDAMLMRGQARRGGDCHLQPKYVGGVSIRSAKLGWIAISRRPNRVSISADRKAHAGQGDT